MNARLQSIHAGRIVVQDLKRYTFYVMLALLLIAMGASAQEGDREATNPAFSQQELDQMLAPIALYPDALLTQILMASTYPLEVVQAARWSRGHAGAKGHDAVDAVADKDWDPSVKSLVAFPQVLEVMDEKIEWTERLGDAFLSQQADVMDSVQSLRAKARAAGNLRSNAQINVQQDGEEIEIEPSSPEIVFVPYYDPVVIYGSWWWPAYPPVFWSPWAGYYWNGGFAWGLGIGIGLDFFFGYCDWPHHHVYIRDRRHWFPPHGGGDRQPWRHDPGHRRGVPYRNGMLDHEFGRSRGAPASREPFRGREAPSIRRPGFAPHPVPLPNRPESSSPNRRAPSAPPRTPFDTRPHAFEDIGRGPEVRDFSARGRSSFPHEPARPAPPPRSPAVRPGRR